MIFVYLSSAAANFRVVSGGSNVQAGSNITSLQLIQDAASQVKLLFTAAGN
jgi:hypothetical protein